MHRYGSLWLAEKSVSRRAMSGLKPVIANDSYMTFPHHGHPERRARAVVAEVKKRFGAGGGPEVERRESVRLIRGNFKAGQQIRLRWYFVLIEQQKQARTGSTTRSSRKRTDKRTHGNFKRVFVTFRALDAQPLEARHGISTFTFLPHAIC